MQGLPGQTLPGVAGERGLPGEKVSVTQPLALKAHCQSRKKNSALSVKLYNTCQGTKGDRGAAGIKGERVSAISLQSNTHTYCTANRTTR